MNKNKEPDAPENPRDERTRGHGHEVERAKEKQDNAEAFEEAVDHPPPGASGEDF